MLAAICSILADKHTTTTTVSHLVMLLVWPLSKSLHCLLELVVGLRLERWQRDLHGAANWPLGALQIDSKNLTAVLLVILCTALSVLPQ